MRYSTKFAIWLAVAAVVPLGGAGAWTVHRIDKAVAELEGERFRLAGRELVTRLEAKAADAARSDTATVGEVTRVLAAEMTSAAAYLGAGAALVGADGTVKEETGDPWGGARDDIVATVLAGGGQRKTHVFTRPCGMHCRRYAAVSPVVPSPFYVAFSLPPGAGSAAVTRLALELVLALVAALFCALAVGFHIAGPLEHSIREILAGARKYRRGEFAHVIAKGPPDEMASVVEELNGMAREAGDAITAAHTRGQEGYGKFEQLTRDTERLRARLVILDLFLAPDRLPAPGTFVKMIVEWFELELRSADKKAVVTGDAAAWPAASPLPRALYDLLDAAKTLGGTFDLALNAKGFALSTPGPAPALLAYAQDASQGLTKKVDSSGERITITVSMLE